MRVAIVAGWFPAVSETFVINHVTGLIDLGIEVDIFAFKQSGEIPHRQLKEYRLSELTTYLPLNLDAHPEAIKPFIDNHYDAIHCHFGMIAERLAFLKPLIPNTRLFVTFHGLDVLDGLKRGGHIYASTFQHCDGVIAICDYNRNRLTEMGCPRKKLIDLPNSIDMDRFHYIPRKPDKVLQIVTTARLHPDKNILFALRVMKSLHDDGHAFTYSIIGDGEQRPDVEAQVKKHGLANQVRLLGTCSQDEVAEHLRQADLFFLPSRNEAFPVSLLEAQATGLPAVTTNVAGTAEAIIDGETGYLVQSNNLADAKEKLNLLINDRDLLHRMGKNARSFVASQFDASVMMKRCAKLYQS